MQFEGAQLSHRSNEPEKNEDRTEDRTEDEADLGKWSHSQFVPYDSYYSPTQFYSKILLQIEICIYIYYIINVYIYMCIYILPKEV